MKQYKIKLLSNESESFRMDIIAHENLSFLDVHQAIQKALDYDSDQMASFFLSNDEWEKNQEFALIRMDDNEQLMMKDSLLKDSIKEENQNLLYIFDFFSERAFFLFVEEINETSELNFVIDVVGEVPQQIVIEMDDLEDLSGVFDEEEEDDAEDWSANEVSLEDLDNLEDY